MPSLREDDETDGEEEEDDDHPPKEEKDDVLTEDEEADSDPPEPPPAGDFATKAEVLQMYCFRPDGIPKTPGKPGDLWLRVSKGKVIPPYSTCPVTVAWPFLQNHEFEYCKKEGMAMLVEPTD